MKITIKVEQPVPYTGKDAKAELSLSIDAPDRDILFAVEKLREECGRLVVEEMNRLGIELDEDGFRKGSNSQNPAR